MPGGVFFDSCEFIFVCVCLILGDFKVAEMEIRVLLKGRVYLLPPPCALYLVFFFKVCVFALSFFSRRKRKRGKREGKRFDL